MIPPKRLAVIAILVCSIPLANFLGISRQRLWADDQREDGGKARSAIQQKMESVAKAYEQKWNVTKQDGLEPVWSIDGEWWSVANDPNSGLIYALGRGGRCAELNVSGKILREFKLHENKGLTLRIAQLSEKGPPQLLTFIKWAFELQAYDLRGNLRWTYRKGVNDACSCDLNGDGSDEVIVGFNGSGGLHVLESEGKLLWQADGANLWHVSANDVLGTGIPQVLTTASGGKVHIFGQDGKKIKVLDPGFHATLVRTTDGSRNGKPGAILVGGKTTLASLSGARKKNWTTELPFHGPTSMRSNIICAQVATGRPWLAIAGNWGDVCVVDTVTGSIIGHVNGQGRSQVCWTKTERGGESLLIVATQKAVNAFRVTR